MDYRREIDGLRALAVIPVIFFHAGFQLFSGGFAGVDVFFVISGYLITTNILSELQEGKFSIINFYERRARRILPALFLVMLFCLPFAWFWLLPREMSNFNQSLIAVSVFVSNFLFWHNTGYFDLASELKPLLHTWSLAVEEQYYLLFPFFMMISWNLGKRWILLILGLVFLTSFILAQWASSVKPSAAFYLLPFRMWELMIGALVARYLFQSYRDKFDRVLSEAGGWLGVACILYAVFAYSKTTPFPGLYALVPTVGAILVILFATQQTIVGRFIGNKLFVGIGLLSYSAYLWHQPLLAFSRVYTFDQMTLPLTLLILIITLIFSYLSWLYVETPFRNKRIFSKQAVFSFSLVGILCFCFIGYVGQIWMDISDKHSALTQALYDWRYPDKLKKTEVLDFFKYDTSRPIDVLFFGDSHAQQLTPISTKLAETGLNVGSLSAGGCPPIPNLVDDLRKQCFDLFDRLNQVLVLEKKIRVIFVAGCFNCYFLSNSRPDPFPGDETNFYYLQGVEKLYFRRGRGQIEAFDGLGEFLQTISSYSRVVLIGDNPQGSLFDPSAILSYKLRGDSDYFKLRYPGFSLDEFKISDEMIGLDHKLSSLAPSGGAYLSLLSIICPDKKCKALDENGEPLYKDSNHLRSKYVTEIIFPYILGYLR